MKKTRSSTKIALGFGLLAAAIYFGYGFISGMIVDRKVFPPIQPGRVNIVGVDPKAGYYVIVANQVAQLVRGEVGEFEVGAIENRSESEKKRVPIREMLRSLQGDEQALGRFAMAMNDMSDAEFPAEPVVWRAEDLRKAIESDPDLRQKLESDLNVRLNGTPIDQIRISALENGIILDLPVTVEVQVGADQKMITGRVQEQYIPRFNQSVWRKLAEKPELTDSIIAGYYRADAKALYDDPSQKEDVGKALLARIDPERLAGFSAIPKKMLASAKVIVSDEYIESAEYREKTMSNGKPMYDLVLNLNDEGRQRLWQYSKRNPNAQLLVTWEGIAIAAPRIRGELALSQVVVSQLFDEGLVRDTVDSINQMKREKR